MDIIAHGNIESKKEVIKKWIKNKFILIDPTRPISDELLDELLVNSGNIMPIIAQYGLENLDWEKLSSVETKRHWLERGEYFEKGDRLIREVKLYLEQEYDKIVNRRKRIGLGRKHKNTRSIVRGGLRSHKRKQSPKK